MGALPPQRFGRGGDRPHRPHGVGAYARLLLLGTIILNNNINKIFAYVICVSYGVAKLFERPLYVSTSRYHDELKVKASV